MTNVSPGYLNGRFTRGFNNAMFADAIPLLGRSS